MIKQTLAATMALIAFTTWAKGDPVVFFSTKGDINYDGKSLKTKIDGPLVMIKDRPSKEAGGSTFKAFAKDLDHKSWTSVILLPLGGSILTFEPKDCKIKSASLQCHMQPSTASPFMLQADGVELMILFYDHAGEANYVATSKGLKVKTRHQQLVITLPKANTYKLTSVKDQGHLSINHGPIESQAFAKLWHNGDKKGFQFVPPNGFLNMRVNGAKSYSIPITIKDVGVDDTGAVVMTATMMNDATAPEQPQKPEDVVALVTGDATVDMVSVFVDYTWGGGI